MMMVVGQLYNGFGKLQSGIIIPFIRGQYHHSEEHVCQFFIVQCSGEQPGGWGIVLLPCGCIDLSKLSDGLAVKALLLMAFISDYSLPSQLLDILFLNVTEEYHHTAGEQVQYGQEHVPIILLEIQIMLSQHHMLCSLYEHMAQVANLCES
ncbi:uncharacterized protein CIMG_12926 [Coccidioides immitis RS]|uniref:Uncharacterized protein n=1 Tax=Coccidioides immitis (strain RS) TaxID=246410 RepID=A0A0D8JTE1_COCIM|nr:uncharacterized protein CIMG_12926 [Coccidioides immitis RS]KJF60394.1 hypothetical protein CIMG_12926 [Coccidioides immitis RS]